MIRPRKSADGPWCWQSKAALRAIREGFEAESGIASGLAVYLALTEIASDRQSDSFQASHAHIAGLTGLSIRTIQNRLDGLAELKLIRVSTPKLRTASTYTLLPFGNECLSLSNDCATSGNGCRALGNEPERAILPTIQESEESEESEKKLPRASRRRDERWEKLAALDGWSPTTPLTGTAGGRAGKALQEILAVTHDATAAEIQRRIDRYPKMFPGAKATSTAIAAHWQRLKPAPAPAPLLDGFIS